LAAVWGAGLGAFIWVLGEGKDVIEAVERFRPQVGSRIYSADGELLGEFTTQYRQEVSLSEMPPYLPKAFVATEDDKFYEHKGVRPDAILNSLLYMLRTGSIRGASTITMQTVRIVEVTKVTQEVTLRRKIKEALIALQLEPRFTKDEILEMYLNQIYLGISANGVEAASLQYFNKSCRDLTLAECALLAGLARNPRLQQPFKYPDRALARRNVVLAQMLENGFITREEYTAAVNEPMDESVVTPEERMELAAQGKGRWAPNKFKAAYFVDDVRWWLLKQKNKEEVFGDGLEIYTTVDMRLQQAAEEALLKGLDEFDAKKREYLARRGQENEFIPVSGALVCIDNRPEYKGWVRAMVGGRDFDKEKFNLATQALRQPGSSVKPFVWAAAIHNGFTPSSVIVDEPLEIKWGPRPQDVWRPQNFTGDHQGPITLRWALAKSVNIISIKLMMQLTMPVVRSYMQRAGITTPIDNDVKLTLALGTPEVKVIDQCVAYSTFANGGVRYDPIMVREIRNRDGFTVYDYRDFATKERAMPENVAYVMTYLMQGAAEWGSGARSKPLNRPRAGKTGTTNESRSVWFCGYTPQLTCVVWMGYKDNRPLGHGENYTGGRLACPIWTDFMIRAHEALRLPPLDFEPPPEGVTFYGVDFKKGLAGGSFQEAFITGTQPPTEWPVPKEPKVIEEAPDSQTLETF
jgi:penicillin-binding protein 1A